MKFGINFFPAFRPNQKTTADYYAAELCRLAGAFRKRNYKHVSQEARLDFMGGLGCAPFSRH
jgi:hypothetical protein